MADILGMMDYIGRRADQGVQTGKQNRLAGLYQQALQGPRDQRSGLIAQMAGVSPQAAFDAEKHFGGMDDNARQRLGQYAAAFDALPDDQKPTAYPQLAAQAQELGIPAPSQWDPSYAPNIQKLAQSLGAGVGGNVQSRFVDQQGNVMVVMRDGSVRSLGVQAENRLQMRDQPGVPLGAFDPRSGTIRGVQEAGAQQPQEASGMGVQFTGNIPPQVQAAIRANPDGWGAVPDGASAQIGQQPAGVAASRPAIAPAEQARLALAAAANQRAEEANARAAHAAELARRGNAPAGFRFKADGSLEPIPGGPKPAGATATEGERKAATLLKRLEGSLSQLESAVRDDPDAASPSLSAEIGRGLPFVGEVAANVLNSPERQRVEAAQLDMLDAALTLGTGAAYTREQLQGYRRAFFPQVGDSDSTIRDKSARLENVIEAARIAAGRAASAVDSPSAGGGWSIKRIGD